MIEDSGGPRIQTKKPQMNVQDLLDNPMVEKHIFLDFDGNIVCRFEHPEFIFEMTQEA